MPVIPRHSRLWHHYQTDSERDALRLKHELERDPRVGFVDRTGDRIVTMVDAARVQQAADSLGGMVVYPIEVSRRKNRTAPLSVFSALPSGFKGFDADDVFDVQTSTTTEEPWRSARPLLGLRLGDRVVVGRQKFDVIRAFDDYTVMAQKPGAKRKAFNVWQNGPTVEVREQRGSPETTIAGPVLASAPYDRVQVVRGDENRSMASYRHATTGQHLRSLSEMLRGSDPFPVLRDFYDSRGPKRQGWIRAINALSTDELIGVAQIAASYGTAAGVELRDQAQEILRRRVVKGAGEMNRAGHGSDVFGRNDVVVQFDDGPEFAKAIDWGVEDATERAISDVKLSPGTRAQIFAKASPKETPDETDAPILSALQAAPLPLGYISNALLYSKIDQLPVRTKARLYRLVKGGHVRVVKTWQPAPQYWLMAK